MTKFNHVMLDLETLSTRTDACIIQIAAIAFDIETGEIGSRFCEYVNETSLLGAKVGHIDVGTVGWWLQQKHAPAMGAALTGSDVLALGSVLGLFAEWFDALEDEGANMIEGVWSHGATFDLPILQDAFERRCPEVYEGKVPWHYKAPRDTRTLYALAPGGMPVVALDESRKHDALYDCEVQVQQVVGALKALRGQASAAALASTLCLEEAQRRVNASADTERGEA